MNILDEGIDCKGKKYKRCNNGKVKNLTGKQFTYLTLIFRVEAKRNSWLCQCKCGNIVVVQVNHLNDGTIKSCGCYNIEQAHKRASINRIGQVFNELTVVAKEYVPNKKGTFWKCLCSCGKYTIVKDENLTSGNTKSCGHLARNIEDLSGKDFGYWHVLNMAPRIEHHIRWNCICRCGTMRAVRGDWLKAGVSQSCGCKHSSRGVDKIEAILNDNKLSYKKEYCFPELKSPKGGALRFDFAIFDNNHLQYLIEFDGEFHYKPYAEFGGEEGLHYRQLCDQIKNRYCIDNQIPLYRIPYFDQSIIHIVDIQQEKYLIS